MDDLENIPYTVAADDSPAYSLNTGGMDDVEITWGRSGEEPHAESVVMMIVTSEDGSFEILHAMTPQQAKHIANKLKAAALLVEDGVIL